MPDYTVLTTSRTERLATAVLLPVAGACAGWAVLTWHDAWRATEWLPMRGPAELVDRVDAWLGPWSPMVLVAAGVVAGLVLAGIARFEEVTLQIADEQVLITSGASARRHRAVDVREAIVDGRHLVLLARDGTELARVRTGFDRSALQSAFRSHGYDVSP